MESGNGIIRIFPKVKSESKVKRRPSSSSNFTMFPELDSLLVELKSSVNGKIVSIRNLSIAPGNKETLSDHIGVGICVAPNLVLTSARVVADLRASATATATAPIYKAHIGGNAALVFPDRSVKLTPVAVSFGSDLAVLKLLEPEAEDPLPVCPMAISPPEKESILMGMSYGRDYGWGISIANVRSVGKKTVKAKAPWPMDDELPWMETDAMVFHRGPPPPCSDLFACKEKLTGSVSEYNGKPLFNLYGELVGIESWELIDDPGCLTVGYAAPLSNIWPVLDYAKTKGPHDPVVMDTWIDSEVIGGDNLIDSAEVIGGGHDQ